MFKQKINTTIMLFCSILLSSSCVMHHRYPQSWSAVRPIEDSQCPDISGTYLNLGDGERGDEKLTSILFPKEPKLGAVTMVTIRQLSTDADTIEIFPSANATSSSERVVSRSAKEFSCSSRGIKIPLGHKAFGGEGLELGVQWVSVYLNKSTDDCLVVKRVTKGAGLLFIIPIIWAHDEDWFRFRPIDGED